MDLGMKDRVAAVAAASQGLGFAAAGRLALEGARVGICSRSQKNIDAAARRIENETGTEVFRLVAELSNADEATGFVDAVAGHFGALDVLVTNAGGPPPGGFEEIGEVEVRHAFDLTLMSTIAMIKAAVPHMRKKSWGRVVNILSLTVKQPELTLLMSNTMRTALVGYTKSVAIELAPENILINNVAPGYTRTERLSELADDLATHSATSADEIFAGWEERIPMGRLGRPEELANVIAFLASEGGSYVTGVTLQVDGGYVKGLF